MPNLILIPHTGIGRDTARALTIAAANDIVAVLEGKKPKYPLNPEVLNKTRSDSQ